ncbi:MAG: antitoxin VbhA family protein [Oscillospiraceae bacterium]
MTKVSIEQAIQNQIASAEMEGFNFESDEIENVKRYLKGEIIYQDFFESLSSTIKRA